ncbi:MAG: carbohydrate ABC transporter permease [Chloroflexi bacterium]|nr:carbohydrate ABC transporter permease [Chloroflexota bacterium]MCY3915402.1 carbohydrate ABC transporter permease [Chloroflexota bacterium]
MASDVGASYQVARQPRRPARYWIARAVLYGVLILFALYVLVPFMWVVFTALKSNLEIAQDPLGLPPNWRFENLAQAWNQGKFSRYFINSVIVTVPIVMLVVSLSCLAGYGLARLKMPGRMLIFYFFLVGLMVPFTAIMIPLFYILRDIGVLGTYWAMILPQTAISLPFGIFFMRAFFSGLPYDLTDAAKIDGCNDFGVFRRVMLPLAGPAVAALVVFNFMGAWNAFLLPLIYLQSDKLRPVMTGMMFFTTRWGPDYSMSMAGTLIVMLPIMLVYLVFQRQFIQGLTAGAVRG